MHRHPSGIAELTVDTADEPLDFQPQVAVFRYSLPAGNHDLNQADLAADIFMPFQQMLKCLEPFRNTLCIIQTIDAESNLAPAHVAADMRGTLFNISLLSMPGKFIQVNSYRETADHG